MGAKVCRKCGIHNDSPYIVDNINRYHCRYHNNIKNGPKELICRDCRAPNNRGNCRHVFEFKLCCFTPNIL